MLIFILSRRGSMVNYPHKIGKITRTSSNISQHIDFANRGMSFESAINESNAYYLAHGLAVIHKTYPVQIVKVDYPKRSRAKIVEAYFRQASTTDYLGLRTL
jgi:recombination protein U